MENYFENEFASLCIHDKIMFVKFNGSIVLDLIVAQSVTKLRLRLQRDTLHAICYDISGIIDSTKSGRDYFSMNCDLLVNAVSIHAGTETSFILACLFKRSKGNRTAFEIFRNLDCAVSFLEDFR